jgi:hypothetical protein
LLGGQLNHFFMTFLLMILLFANWLETDKRDRYKIPKFFNYYLFKTIVFDDL